MLDLEHSVLEISHADARRTASYWKENYLAGNQRIKELEVEVAHRKANHDNQVQRARILIDRPDCPLERVKAHTLLGDWQTKAHQFESKGKDLEQKNTQLRAAIKQKSDELRDAMNTHEQTIIGYRARFKELEAERDGLLAKTKWQPIETAPKDRIILGFNVVFGVYSTHYVEEKYDDGKSEWKGFPCGLCDVGLGRWYISTTHWRELPEGLSDEMS